MKPIKLVMKAFGPYANEQVIDFEALKDQLYLITGPTGAGKTTIFDGISYALYGQVSGESRQVDDARSHFATADILTEVVLDFSLHDRYYRVHRIPKQVRQSKRGNRMIEQKPEATLYMDDGPISNTATVITGIKEVNEMMETIIGVNEDQFKQIMMIPQGEFRKLLTEGSSEREKVLGRLFDTALYRKIQEQLSELSKGNRIAIEKLKTESQGLLKLITMADASDHSLNLAVNQADMSLIQVSQVLEGIDLLAQEDFKRIEGYQHQLEQLDQAYDKQIQVREKADHINQSYSRLSRMEVMLKGLLDRQEAVDRIKDRLKKADQANKVMPKYKAVIKQQQMLEDQTSTLQEHQRALGQIRVDFDEAQKQLDEVKGTGFQTALSDMKQQQVHLATMSEKLSVYVEQKLKVDDIRRHATVLASAMRTATEELEKAKGTQKHIKEQLISYDEIKETVSHQKLDLVKQEQLEEKLMDLTDHIMKGVDSLDGYHKALGYETEVQKDLDEATRQWKRLRMKHHMDQAAMLASELAPGEPCPVCGSKEHPNVAKGHGPMVTEEDLEAAEHQVESSRMFFNKASEKRQLRYGQVESHRTNAKALIADVPVHEMLPNEVTDCLESMDTDLWKQCHKAYELQLIRHRNHMKTILQSLNELDGKIRLLEDQQKKLSSLENMMSTLETEAKEAEERHQEASMAYTQEKGLLEGLGKDIPESYMARGVLEAAIGTLNQQVQEMESRKESAESTFEMVKESLDRSEATILAMEAQLKKEVKQLDALTIELNEALLINGFDVLASCLTAVIDETAYDDLKEQANNYDKQLIETQQSIKDLTESLKGTQITQLSVYDEALERLRQERQSVLDLKEILTRRTSQNMDVKVRLQDINGKMSQVQSAYEKIGRLSMVAGGKNSQNMTFERYVLAQLLQDITKAANLRLDQMTGGRYRLLRAEGTRDARKSGGLDLAISDQYTGTIRSVTSLSGGEMFKASLSMALGLSDVVQSYCGGVKLDAMFIDEGFGSLDQNSLDQAITCLVDLQKTGRSIGIISHVAELKDRISTRIEIVPSPVGSSAKIVHR